MRVLLLWGIVLATAALVLAAQLVLVGSRFGRYPVEATVEFHDVPPLIDVKDAPPAADATNPGSPAAPPAPSVAVSGAAPAQREPMSDDQWRKILTAEEFNVIREQGTEFPFTSPLDHEKRPGTYYSADCGVPLFRSEQKFDSGTGWPSFWAPISPDVVTLKEVGDAFLGARVEVRDAKCDGHLGHVFDDGPPPTGKRYCMNGVALRFVPDKPE